MKQQQSQSQQMRQGYYLSQYHMKLMHIMHLSGYALQEYISNELEQNPVLEKENTNENDEMDEGFESNGVEREMETDLFDDDLLERNYKQLMTQEEYYEAPVVQYNSLQENLKEQIHMMKLDQELSGLCCFIIDELDDDGFLRRTVEDVAFDYGFANSRLTQASHAEEALSCIQKCDPPGVGARDIRECLHLQLLRKRSQGNRLNELAIRIFEEQYQNLIQRNYHKIRIALKISEEDFTKCIGYIGKLNPKPVTDINKYELLREQIVPDFEVFEDEGRLIAMLTTSDHSDLFVNPDYCNKVVSSVKDPSEQKQTENYFQKLVGEAQSLITALKERESTMLKIIQTIVARQPDFFHSGELSTLRPMILQDIANVTGHDISSISRITSNKHVQTPYGIFPLKSLFMRGISSQLSTDGSLTAVRVHELIQNIINAEDKLNPYSDQVIAQMLKDQGAVIARRTVVKYRELMGIPNSSLRKVN